MQSKAWHILVYYWCSEINESELSGSTSADKQGDDSSPSISLVKKKFIGKYAISAKEFTNETVRAYKP